MAEVQTSQQSGEMSQRFVSFVIMQAQQIALCLGQLPHPETGKPVPNLEAARLLIDQLEMIREKTRGNLTSEESHILSEVLADVQLGFVKATSQAAETSAPRPSSSPEAPSAPSGAAGEKSDAAGESFQEENKKRFSKSYG